MKHAAITEFGPRVLTCPDSPHERFVIAWRLLGMTVYLLQTPEGDHVWGRCAEYKGEPTAYVNTREEAEALLHSVLFFAPRVKAQRSEQYELSQAA